MALSAALADAAPTPSPWERRSRGHAPAPPLASRSVAERTHLKSAAAQPRGIRVIRGTRDTCSGRTRRPVSAPSRRDVRAAVAHLNQRAFPPLKFETVNERLVALEAFCRTPLVLYLFSGTPRSPFEGPRSLDADLLQLKGFCRYAYRLREFGYTTVGVSTQEPHKLILNEREGELNHDLFSDRFLRLASALEVPTFTAGQAVGFHRIALVIREGVIRHAILAQTPRSHADQVLSRIQRA